jgi:glycosyltransferase involved in cell wall biosynthesis
MLRLAIVPPVPVPYREPLFERLAARPGLALRVIYQAPAQPSWDQARAWFPARHGYDAAHLRAWQLARPGRSPLAWPRGLERALARFDPDVVVVSEFGPATLRALAWCRARRRRLVVLTEVTASAARALSPPQRTLHRLLARRADGFIAVSSAARERLLGLGAAPETVAVSLQSADEDALSRAFAGRRPVEATPVELLTVSRLVPDKDVAALLDAFAASGLEERDATLSVVGSGPLAGSLRAHARALGVPVRFLGALPPAALPARYAAAGAFVLASRHEPFGVALREAVIAGLPVVCSTAVGAASDLAREGANAILFAPRDVPALASGLARICRDPALRRELGAGSRRIAQEHPLDADVEAFASLVNRVARGAHARR